MQTHNAAWRSVSLPTVVPPWPAELEAASARLGAEAAAAAEAQVQAQKEAAQALQALHEAQDANAALKVRPAIEGSLSVLL